MKQLFSRLGQTDRGALALVIQQGLRMALGFGLTLAVARVLGPERFGTYSALISLAWIFQGLASVGMNTPLAQFLAKEPLQERYWIGGAFLVQILALPLVVVLFLVLAFGTYGDSGEMVYGILLLLPVLAFPLAENFHLRLVQLGKAPWSALASFVAFLIGGACVLLVLHQGQIGPLIGAFTLEFVVLAVILAGLHLRTGGGVPKLDTGWQALRTFWPYALPVLVAVLFQLLQQRFALLALERWSGPEEAGLYAAATRIFALISTFTIVMVGPFFAEISQAYFHEPVNYPKILHKRMAQLWIVGGAGALGLVVVAPWLLPWAFGPEYAEAVTLVLPLALAAVLAVPRVLYDRMISLWGKPWFEAWSYIFWTCALGFWCWLLVPIAGAAGAAWATLLSVLTGMYLPLVWGKENHSFVKALWASLWALVGKASKKA